jgi:hypothetical protein
MQYCHHLVYAQEGDPSYLAYAVSSLSSQDTTNTCIVSPCYMM